MEGDVPSKANAEAFLGRERSFQASTKRLFLACRGGHRARGESKSQTQDSGTDVHSSVSLRESAGSGHDQAMSHELKPCVMATNHELQPRDVSHGHEPQE